MSKEIPEWITELEALTERFGISRIRAAANALEAGKSACTGRLSEGVFVGISAFTKTEQLQICFCAAKCIEAWEEKEPSHD